MNSLVPRFAALVVATTIVGCRDSKAPEPCTAARVGIATPVTGTRVVHRPLVRGSVEPSCSKVTLAVHPLAVSKYWVQPQPTVASDGSWQAMPYIGEAEANCGEPFELVAFGNPDRVLGEGEVLDQWPQAQARSDVVTVIRDCGKGGGGGMAGSGGSAGMAGIGGSGGGVAGQSGAGGAGGTGGNACSLVGLEMSRPSAGARVRTTEAVSGEIDQLPAGAHVWVLVRRHDFDPMWWPQREAPPKDGRWTATATFGGPQDTGWEFDVAAILVDEQQHIELKGYWTTAMSSGHWPPIQVRAPLCQVTRRVRRQ
jgi:hypothetical protein